MQIFSLQYLFTLNVPCNESHYLSAGAGLIGLEDTVAIAEGYALLVCPQDRVVVRCAASRVGYVAEAVFAVHSGSPAKRQRKVTTCARVQVWSGLKLPSSLPRAMPFSFAHSMAL